MWINEPYEAGMWPDISIFRNSLKSHLGVNERVEADDGYVGEAPLAVKCPRSFVNSQETEYMQARVRSRQETVNKRFKDWGALRQVYRHEIPDHGKIFNAVAVITQLAISNGEKLFECGYRDPPWGSQSDSDLSYSDDSYGNL